MKKLIAFGFISLILLAACGRNYSPEQKKYISEIQAERVQKNFDFQNADWSPIKSDPKAVFHPLKYYDVDPDFVFQSKLTEYPQKDTITIFGTKGEPRKTVKYGYLTFSKFNRQFKLNVYESFAKNGQSYFSTWFTDNTTNEETDGVGRYLDFELSTDPNHIYTIDFNKAFNPYCAYSANYSCAIPSKEDYLDLSITAGEKKFHD